MSILLVDSYDSFTYNLKDLLQRAIPEAEIYTIHNDALLQHKNNKNTGSDISEYADYIVNKFDCIVIGPGPGNPNFDSSITDGVIPLFFSHSAFDNIPILGICLGFQLLGMLLGYDVSTLNIVKHGQISPVFLSQCATTETNAPKLFEGFLDGFKCVRYHSLHVVNQETYTEDNGGMKGTLVPLAYTEDYDPATQTTIPVLMAGKHFEKPYYGVQYHPESICSEKGLLLIQNFWRIAQWNKSTPKITDQYLEQEKRFSQYYVNTSLRLDETTFSNEQIHTKQIYDKNDIHFVKLSLENVAGTTTSKPTFIVDLLKHNDTTSVGHDYFVLDSSNIAGSSPSSGSYSIIGHAVPNHSLVITWSLSTPDTVTLSKWKSSEHTTISLAENHVSIWGYLQQFMLERFVKNSLELNKLNIPFAGGLVGFISYESGQFIDQKLTATDVPDIKMVFIDETLVYDECSKQLVVLALGDQGKTWVKKTAEFLQKSLFSDFKNDTTFNAVPSHINDLYPEHAQIKITTPDKQDYLSRFKQCQDCLQNGDSYELCLCCPTTIEFPENALVDPWEIYKVLNLRNPAPFTGYLQFDDDTVLISSSPERFLSWKNNTLCPDKKTCQLRPIKGTVKKTPQTTYATAQQILYTPKEMAENLMIVDLIRHDLYSHTNTNNVSNVRVSKLMQIEEYKTVYQLVSVIECDIKSTTNESIGLNILSTSLPPGSMTGAPKKRSVELLQHEIELPGYGNRGIYSGVYGYWSIDDQADWSVVIRSMFTYGSKNDAKFTKWRIGAGGAITALSDPEGEWQEMNVKLDSIRQIFS